MLLSESDRRLKKYENLRESVNETFVEGRKHAQEAVEYEKAKTYWTVGTLIEKHVLLNEKRGDYGKKIVNQLAKDLGTNQTLLYYALQFAKTYKEFPQNKKMSWSHYRALLPIKNEKERNDLAVQVEEWGWSSRQLEKAIGKTHLKKDQDKKRALLKEDVVFVDGEIYEVVDHLDSDSKRPMLAMGFDVFYQLSKMPGHFYAGDFVKLMASQKGDFKFIKITKPKGYVRKYSQAWITVLSKTESCILIDLGLGMKFRKCIALSQIKIDSKTKMTKEGFCSQLKRFQSSGRPAKVLISYEFAAFPQKNLTESLLIHQFL